MSESSQEVAVFRCQLESVRWCEAVESRVWRIWSLEDLPNAQPPRTLYTTLYPPTLQGPPTPPTPYYFRFIVSFWALGSKLQLCGRGSVHFGRPGASKVTLSKPGDRGIAGHVSTGSTGRIEVTEGSRVILFNKRFKTFTKFLKLCKTF